MAGVNRSNTGLLWENRVNDIAETLNRKSKIRNTLKQEKWGGSHIEWPVHTAGTPAIWYMEDAGQLPTPNKQDYVRAKSYVKFLGGTIQYSDGAAASTSGANAIKDVVDNEMKRLILDMSKMENFFFLRDGTGVVAEIQASSSTTTIVVDDARGLWDKASYDVYTSNLGTFKGTVTVARTANTLTAQNATVTLTGNAPAVVSGDVLVWQNSLNRAITGLDALIDDAAAVFQNVNVSTYPRYSSLVLDGGGAAQDLTPTLFRQLLSGIQMKTGSDTPAEGFNVWTEPYVMSQLEELYEGEYRTAPSDTVAGQAITSFQTALGKLNLRPETDCPYGKIFFVDQSDVYRTVLKDLYWRRNDKGAIFTVDQNSITYRASCLELCDLRIHSRISSGKITNLNETKVTPY